jgi:hypothetical protein
MKIGYLLDTHGGPYNMPIPTGAQVTTFIDHLWREATASDEKKSRSNSLCWISYEKEDHKSVPLRGLHQ